MQKVTYTWELCIQILAVMMIIDRHIDDREVMEIYKSVRKSMGKGKEKTKYLAFHNTLSQAILDMGLTTEMRQEYLDKKLEHSSINNKGVKSFLINTAAKVAQADTKVRPEEKNLHERMKNILLNT